MKRFTALKYFKENLKKEDVVIFSGPELCKEAAEFCDRSENFYLENTFGVSVAFATGLAMCTDRRVFVFVGEGDLIRELSSAAHLAVSKCKNLFLVILDNGVYQSMGNFPNIFSEFLSTRGVLFNFGLMTYNLTRHMQDKRNIEISTVLERCVGPAVITIHVDKGIKKDLKPLNLDKAEHVREFAKFVRNKDIDTALYKPPSFVFPEQKEVRSINLDELYGGN